MKDTTSDRIGSDPRFKEVAERRNRLAWTLFAITMTLYFGLILTATLNPSALTTPISGGSPVAIGWPIGAAVILIPWLLTILYVRRANADSRAMTSIVKEALA